MLYLEKNIYYSFITSSKIEDINDTYWFKLKFIYFSYIYIIVLRKNKKNQN